MGDFSTEKSRDLQAGTNQRTLRWSNTLDVQVVWYRGSYLTTARTAFMRGVAGRWWWFNEAYLCQAAAPAFESPTCARLDPWRGTFKECAWSGLVDTAGSEVRGSSAAAAEQQQQQQRRVWGWDATVLSLLLHFHSALHKP